MRKEFTMTDEQHAKVMDACKPVPYLVIGGVSPRSPQEHANGAWRSLGAELGFKWDTVQPIAGMCDKHFSAEPLAPAPAE